MSFSKQDFARWLAEQLNASDLQIEGWTSPEDVGFSNETILFSAHYLENGKKVSRRLVLRLEPAGEALFRDYDLARQCQFMEFLHANSSLPVPAILGKNLSGDRQYYVMEYIAGEIPLDGLEPDSSYHNAGFIHDASPDERRALCASFTKSLAELHRVSVPADAESLLTRPQPEETHFQRDVRWITDYYLWAKGGAGVNLPADALVEWVVNNAPNMDDNSIVWGDARLANIIARNFSVVAMLDWELASLGPGEQDLFWGLVMQRFKTNQEGAKKLNGMMSESEQIALYEERTGRHLRHAEFFEAYALVRIMILQVNYIRSLGGPVADLKAQDFVEYDKCRELMGI